MDELLVTLDGVHGDVKIVAQKKNEKHTIKLRWYKAEDDTTGFICNITDSPIPVTELAAELMIKIILSNLIQVLELDASSMKIFNHLGEKIRQIEFMPPTFDGKEADIQKFVAKQDSLQNLYSLYEDGYQLNSQLLSECEGAGVLDDFLSLVQFQLTKVMFTFSKSKE